MNAHKQKNLNTFRPAKGESGQILVMVAIFLVALLAMAGLAVDGGGLYYLERDAQNAVDAAALAATYELCRDGGNRATAENRAINTLASHAFVQGQDGTSINITTPTAQGQTNADYYIQIELTAEKPNYFIRVVNPDDLLVTVSAVGECKENESNYTDAAIVGVAANCNKDTVNVTGSFGDMDDGTNSFVDGLITNGTINTKGSNKTPMIVEGAYKAPSKDAVKGWSNAGGVESINGLVLNGHGPDSADQINQMEFTGGDAYEVLYRIEWFDTTSSLFNEIYSAIAADRDAAISTYGSEAVRVVEAVVQAVNDGMYHRLEARTAYNFSMTEQQSIDWGQPQNYVPKEGLIYVYGGNKFSMSGGNYNQTDGPFTLVAEGQINISGSRWVLGSSYLDPISLFSWYGASVTEDDPSTSYYDPNYHGDCNNGINVSASSTSWEGLIYAPFGNVNISMSQSSAPVYGQIIGFSVNVSVSKGQFRFNNDFLPGAPPTLGLIN